MACSQQPTGNGRAQTTTELYAQRGAGVHGSVHALMLREPGVFGAGCDHSIHIALPRPLTESSDCGKEQHQRNIAASHVTSHGDQCTGNRCQSVAHHIQLVHTAPLCDQRRSEHQRNNQRDVDCPREYTEQVLIAQNVGGVVGAHADHGTVDLLEDVSAADHHIVFVAGEKFCSLHQIVFFVLLGTVLRDKRSQRRVCDVVGSVEHCVQQRVCDQEPCVLRKLPKAGGNRKNCNQSDGASDLTIQHPGTSLAHFGMGLIDQ